MNCITTNDFPMTPVVPADPNIPFEVYLKLISPIWYPRQLMQCPQLRDRVLQPRPLFYNPRYSMMDIMQSKSNSICLPPVPYVIGNKSRKIVATSDKHGKDLMLYPCHAAVSTMKSIDTPPSESFLRENTKQTGLLGTSVAAVETKSEKHDKSPNIKKYGCKHCGRRFSRSNTLVTHERIHTGEKPFECELCHQKFRQYGNLVRHKIVHTNLKPFACHLCKRAFNRKSNLKTHMQIHGKNK